MKNISAFIIVIIFILLVIFPVQKAKVHTPDESKILSFQDCVDAGFPVMEIYPGQCRTPDGRIFTEEIPEKITYTNASADLIVVDLPFPGAVTGKEFSVVGHARGYWFFEASFPIELLDKDGNLLDTGIAQAEGEWMTENFVPFKADLKAPISYIGPATLVLKKDNASGLPEHDASISFPITIEY
ncbi:MAG: Gmad2 immunoglobulin-like domain-containing protein [Patescibacteria group bacterium]